jgi:hypothetical protein
VTGGGAAVGDIRRRKADTDTTTKTARSSDVATVDDHAGMTTVPNDTKLLLDGVEYVMVVADDDCEVIPKVSKSRMADAFRQISSTGTLKTKAKILAETIRMNAEKARYMAKKEARSALVRAGSGVWNG